MTRTSLLHAFVLTVASASIAAAQTQISSPGGLSASDAIFTNPDAAGTTYSGNVTYTATGTDLTFSSVGNAIEVDQANVNYFSTAFADNTKITYAGGYGGPSSPLTILFSKPVSEFGFGAEEFAFGSSTFTFDMFNGATMIGRFTSTGFTDDPSAGGVLAFLGARATSITSVVISDDNGDNIGVGPISYQLATGGGTTVPEPTSIALAGAGLVGLGLLQRRRRARVA
ncbi:hypothetical protein tb265_05840 [Gemmatimonadetes bacterium T265]|nr:hypothetical protein tb265_05840 [Gemmatimonadetes bacterium T265]